MAIFAFIPVKTVINIDDGPVAQLGERCVRIAEVEGSNPFRSTKVNNCIVNFTLDCFTAR